MVRSVLVVVAGLGACRPQQTAPTAEATYFPVVQDSLWGFIDAGGQVSIPPQFERAWPFSEGLALVKIGDRYGYIDPDGETVIPPQFTDAWFFSGGLAPVEKDGQWVYIDRSGKTAVEPAFRIESSVLEQGGKPEPQLGRTRVGDFYGYVNPSGDIVIEPRYNQAWNFVEGLARVRVGGRWGYIRPDGSVAIEPRFDLAWDFSGGLALVEIDGKYGYVDPSGSFVWEPTR